MADIYSGEFNLDIFPPSVTNPQPAPGAINVVHDANVEFDITDTGGSGVDQNTISVDIGGADAITNGVFQSGYSGTITPITDGFHVTINPDTDFPNLTLIQVDVDAADLAPIPNTMPTFSWSFTTLPDIIAPTIVALSPFEGQTAVPPNTTVQISFRDEAGGSGIDGASINVDLGGANAVINGVFQTGWDGPGSQTVANGSNGFDVTIDPLSNFADFTIITVDANVDDNQGNPVTKNYTFETGSLTEADPPTITQFIPADNTTEVATNTNIFFRIEDVGSGVDQTTINVIVAGESAIVAGIFQTGYTGTIIANINGGFDVNINRFVDYASLTFVRVQVDCTDIVGNVMPTVYSHFFTGTYQVALSPTGGLFNTPVTVTISDNGSNSAVHYTTDGTDPIPGMGTTTTTTPPENVLLPTDATTEVRVFGVEEVSYDTLPVVHTFDNGTQRLYQMDEAAGTTITDTGLGGADLSSNNTNIVAGLVGNARQFLGTPSSRAFQTSNFSWFSQGYMEFWYNPSLATNPNPEHFYTAALDAGLTTDAYRFGRTSETLFMEDVVGASTLSTAALSWTADEWYHIAYVWTLTGRQILRNGVVVASDSNTMTTTLNVFGEMLGNSFDAVVAVSDAGTEGLLDSFKISSDARTPTEFAEDYNRGVITTVTLQIQSTTQIEIYTIDLTKPVTTITPNGGIFNNPVIVRLTSSESGSTIYYTTDGSNPTAPGDLGYPGTTQAVATPHEFLLSLEGVIEIKAFSIDPAGNREVL